MERVDGSDATLIVAANGGSDLVYVPSGSADIVHKTIDILMQLDYVGGLFVDDRYCAAPSDCPCHRYLSPKGRRSQARCR